MTFHIAVDRRSTIIERLTVLRTRDIVALYELNVACRNNNAVIRPAIRTSLVKHGLLDGPMDSLPEDVRAIVIECVVGRGMELDIRVRPTPSEVQE